MKKAFPKKFKTCGKGHLTSLKPQKSSEGLTGYFLMRWFRTKVPVIIRYPYQPVSVAELPTSLVSKYKCDGVSLSSSIHRSFFRPVS
jgi:hypothetical protein